MSARVCQPQRSKTPSPIRRNSGRKRAGVKGEQSMNALGILRALVRGFVLHEMAASFPE
jgi:hypothetical protein